MFKYSANLSTIYRDVPLREALQKVSEAGLNAIEFLFVSVYGLPKLVAARNEFNLEVALFDLEIGQIALYGEHECLSDIAPERRSGAPR